MIDPVARLPELMDKLYAPQEIERRIYERWEKSGWFAPSGTGEPYCIVIPPPNVTGTLHMGHAFQHTLMDALTRYHRMRGADTLWQPGTDHAGIATQMVVERQLEAAGQHRSQMSRDDFVARVWQWKQESGGTICAQMRRLGESVDWARERFTMDAGLSQAVAEAFVRLHEEGLIYRGKRLVNWDPVLLTALSDLEVQGEEEDGHLWHLSYPLEDGGGHLIVATTRPETMLGDTAVAVNPQDERYRHLVGRKLRLPLTERLIPIIADDYVDAAFGSGCVKITPAHDFNDYEIGKRHNLAQINIFTPQAHINDNAPARFVGLDRYEARRRILDELTQAGLLARIDKHRHIVPRGDRSGAVLEPYLTEQWYVKVEPLAREAVAAVRDGRTRFVPENWSRTYFEWMKNIHDWCISRQLWWGHRIPAWYDAAGKVYVGRDEADARLRHGLGPELALTQDSDVLDTWFSSALWPFSTQGWPQDTPQLRKFYPTNVLVTAFDIIFFWVARMMMMGLKFMGDVPFRDVYITGLILDEFGEKMSKSKGNVIDPLDIVDGIDLESLLTKRTTGLMQPQLKPAIEKHTRRQFPQGIPAHGTDALRFTLAALATPTREIRFDLARVEGYRKFCNKLWNAARFVMLMVESSTDAAVAPEFSTADRWIRSRFGRLLGEVESAMQEYRFDFAANALYQFTWYEFCDWYLELTKPVLQSSAAQAGARSAARATLLDILEALQRALHPLMPFITEEIWQKVAPLAARAGPSVMIAPYPVTSDYPADDAAEQDLSWVQQFVLAVRQIRGEMNIAPSRRLPVLLRGASEADWQRAVRNGASLEHLAGLSNIERLAPTQEAPQSATAMLGELNILVPMAGLIDAAAEIERLSKRLAKATQELARTRAKLASDTFVRNAPETVVAAERDREVEQQRSVIALQAQLDDMRKLGP
ncbi:MAG TPA: valine--tRNA ligase [Steroidobacteraceae bacterium]|jgi:valyl-tRNA synthetase|nr:valine--tRNA ligase [Steroidobacteraceae bacterium]